MYSQNGCDVKSQGGHRVFLTWVSKGNTGDGAQVDAFAIGCSMQLAGKHQDEQYEPGPSHGYILGSHKADPALCPSIYLLIHSGNSRHLFLKSWLAENRMQVNPFAYDVLNTDALESKEQQSHWVSPSESMFLSPNPGIHADSQIKELWNRKPGGGTITIPWNLTGQRNKAPVSNIWMNSHIH